MQEGLWIKMFLMSLTYPVTLPIELMGDNQDSLDLTNSESTSSRSKHINIKYHFICGHIEDGTFATHWVPTKEMTADIFTKPLSLPLHEHHVAGLGMVRR